MIVKNEWVQTDSLQWIKKETENIFSVLNVTYENDLVTFNEEEVNLNDYVESELEEIISSYYESLEEVKQTYKESWKQIVAECIVEQTDSNTFKTNDLEEAYLFLADGYGIELNFNEL